MKTKILLLGASGQIGTKLTKMLRRRYGKNQVIASDIKAGNKELMQSGPFEFIDALDKKQVEEVINKHKITDLYLLAVLLSGASEKMPFKAWELNINPLLHILELARYKKIQKLFWPSSIAVFGDNTPKEKTSQTIIKESISVYRITKLAGERWCEYFYTKYGVDRSIRYPGIISWKPQPSEDTTDYAIEIYQKALTDKHYTCFLEKNTKLPMLYIEDAVRVAIQLMESPKERIKIRSSYNVGGFSAAPNDFYKAIKKHIPAFTINYQPDFRQQLAASWPASIDDSCAAEDWGWQAKYSLEQLNQKMLDL